MMNPYRDYIKKDFGGQTLNRYERVCALLSRYTRIIGNPSKTLIDLAVEAVFNDKSMRKFIRKMPKKNSYHKQDKKMDNEQHIHPVT